MNIEFYKNTRIYSNVCVINITFTYPNLKAPYYETVTINYGYNEVLITLSSLPGEKWELVAPLFTSLKDLIENNDINKSSIGLRLKTYFSKGTIEFISEIMIDYPKVGSPGIGFIINELFDFFLSIK